MTSTEMKYAILTKFDSFFENSAPAYDNKQLSLLANDAQFRVFIRAYNPLADKYKQGFEGSEKRQRDLFHLIRTETLDDNDIHNGIGQHPNGTFYSLPSDYLYAIEEGATQSGDSFESTVMPIPHDRYHANINNPYKKPYEKLVWRMYMSTSNDDGITNGDDSARTELITHDGAKVDSYRLRYLAKPPEIVINDIDEDEAVDCILDTSLHMDIVDEAVAIAMAAVKKESYQIGLNEQNRSE